MDLVIERLLASEEPSVRLKVRVGVLGEDPESPGIADLREEIRVSPRVRALLSERGPDGRVPYHPYAKWYGAHWVLATLADLGYPPGDETLVPLRDQAYEWLLSKKHLRGVPVIEGRARRCGSQEGNALWASLTLGLADERAGELARNLMRWQWPDGGWNCDVRPAAATSSFHETLIPMRALVLYAWVAGCDEAEAASRRAAEVFLERRLFRRRRDGEVMDERFLRLMYPSYWRYNILMGLRVMAEAGLVEDPRCAEALDVLESKRLPDGGFPAEERFYHTRAVPRPTGGSRSLVDWGGANRRRMNEWVTADALAVLKAAGRLATS